MASWARDSRQALASPPAAEAMAAARRRRPLASRSSSWGREPAAAAGRWPTALASHCWLAGLAGPTRNRSGRLAWRDAGVGHALRGLRHCCGRPLRHGSAAFQRAHVAHPRNVLALDLHGCARFPRKSRDRLRALRRLRQQELERDLVVQVDVLRSDYDAHAAGAQDLLDPVLAGQDVAFAHPANAVETAVLHV